MLNVDGLASGLDTSSIIEQILSLQRRPIALLQNQIARENEKQTAFASLSAKLLNLQLTARKLSEAKSFRAVTASSSNPEVMEVSAQAGVPPGVYSFRVAQLARTSQHISVGFADSDTGAVGAGTLEIELGGGFIDVQTELDELNGGAGVRRGSIRIIDRAGNAATVDLSAAITVGDAIAAINDAAGIAVTAAVAGSADANTGKAIVLTDTSGGTGTFAVEEVAGGATAADLGIAGTSATATLAGSAIRVIGSQTALSSLRDGLGLRGNGTTAGDITITNRDGETFSVDVDGISTVGALMAAVNTHAGNIGGKVTLAAAADGEGFVLSDSSAGAGTLTVANGALANAASDLGIAGSAAAATIAGSRVLAGIDDVLLSSLNGGSGVAAGSISITNRAGATTIVSLAAAETLRDVMRAIDASAALVTASVNAEGNGLALRDNSAGAGTLSVAESGSTTAANLGILGAGSGADLRGTDLDPRYVHANTKLSTLNGGRGVAGGTIRITDANGVSFTVNLSNNTDMGDVILDIQGAAAAAGSNVTAGFNAAGNGLLLASPTGGGTLRVDEVNGGTTAADLNIAGPAPAATPGTIDGAFERTIAIAADDTLEDVLRAIQDLGMNVQASIVNDGSASAPYRLSITSEVSGRAGRVGVAAGGGTGLAFTQTAAARDGVLFFGDSAPGSEALLIRSGTNTYSDVVKGLTVTAFQTSATPVQIAVQRDDASVTELVKELVDGINEIIGEVNALTAFNSETNQRGILIGDSTANNIKRSLFAQFTRPLAGIENQFALLSQIGIRIAHGRVTFDSAKFESALAASPDAVQRLFGASRPFEDSTKLADFNNGRGVGTTANADFRIHLRSGATVDVDISAARTLAEVIAAINTAGGASVQASYSTSQNSIVLNDTTTGATAFRVTALNSSSAANDLGIDRSADATGGAAITGEVIDLSGDLGMAARLEDLIESLVGSDGGAITRRTENLDEHVAGLEDRIEALEERLISREEALRRQFAHLEEIISASQSTLQRLTAQLSTLGARG